MSPYRLALAVALVAACGGKIDPSAIDSIGTKTIDDGPPATKKSGPPSHSSSGGGAAITCADKALVPFEMDFDDGSWVDGFTVNSPSAFIVDWDDPIRGSASLRVDPSPASFIARKVKSACAARLQFTFRADEDFFGSGGSIARIDAGSRRFSILVGPANVFLIEEVSNPQVGSLGSGPSHGIVYPNDPTKFTLDVDLAAKKVTFGFTSPRKGSSGTKVLDMTTAFPLDREPAITSIEIGTAGSLPPAQAGYWIDDISIH